MNTKVIMMFSSLFMGLLGITFSFLPVEIVAILSLPIDQPLPLMVQILGGLYFGFAMLNWMAKDNVIGGIYSRPVCIANLTHFSMVFFALIKAVYGTEPLQFLWPLVVIYCGFSVLFAYILFANPVSQQS